MKACVLIAAPEDRLGSLADALQGYDTIRVADERRAALLAAVGEFRAIVVTHDFLVGHAPAGLDCPFVRLGPATDLHDLPAIVDYALHEARERDLRRSATLENLGSISYSTYMELVRYRATRRYLLGLMRAHGGSVTEASLAAGIARESLHRLLRRHDIDTSAFREADGS